MSSVISVRGMCLALIITVLGGCGVTHPPAAQPLLSAAESAARTTVPLTRPIALDKAGTLIDLAFDLPAPAPPAIAVLMLGIRIQAPDTQPLLDASDRITQCGLPARVLLERLDGDAPTRMRLVRFLGGPREFVVLPEDGYVPYVTVGGVGDGMLREAGLYDETKLYRILVFAELEHALPGRYRLTVDLAEDRAELRGQPAELIIAYRSLGK